MFLPVSYRNHRFLRPNYHRINYGLFEPLNNMMLVFNKFNTIVDDFDFIAPRETPSEDWSELVFPCKQLIFELNKLVSYGPILICIIILFMYVTFTHTYFFNSQIDFSMYIGMMDPICPHCEAANFPGETPGMCVVLMAKLDLQH